MTTQPKCRHIRLSWSEHCNHRIKMHMTHLSIPAFFKYSFVILRELNLAVNSMPLSTHLIQIPKEIFSVLLVSLVMQSSLSISSFICKALFLVLFLFLFLNKTDILLQWELLGDVWMKRQSWEP